MVTHLHILARNYHCGFTLAHRCDHVTSSFIECDFRKHTQHYICQFQTGHKGNGLTIPNPITKSQVEHPNILLYFVPSLHSTFHLPILRLVESFYVPTKKTDTSDSRLSITAPLSGNSPLLFCPATSSSPELSSSNSRQDERQGNGVRL